MKGIKHIIKKLIGYKNPIQKLVSDGSIVVGENSDISGMQVVIKKKQNRVYVKIGSNSVISGTFVLETEEAKIEIGSDTFIGGGLFVAAEKITIGNDVMFSWGCTVSDTNAHSLAWDERKNDVREWKKGLDEGKEGFYKNWQHVKTKPVLVDNKCWIGFNTVILKGVTLAEECVVGAASVVTKSYSEGSVVGGNPATLIKTTK